MRWGGEGSREDSRSALGRDCLGYPGRSGPQPWGAWRERKLRAIKS